MDVIQDADTDWVIPNLLAVGDKFVLRSAGDEPVRALRTAAGPKDTLYLGQQQWAGDADTIVGWINDRSLVEQNPVPWRLVILLGGPWLHAEDEDFDKLNTVARELAGSFAVWLPSVPAGARDRWKAYTLWPDFAVEVDDYGRPTALRGSRRPGRRADAISWEV